MADLRHNSDIRRLKGVRQKDVERIAEYHRFYLELQHMEAPNAGNEGPGKAQL